MEWLDEIYRQVAYYVSIPYMLIFIFLSYLVKRYFGELLAKITRVRWRTVYTVLVIATVLAVPFILFTDEGWVKILLSYATGTSLHELIFQWIEKKFTHER